MATVYEIIQGLNQAAANAYDGAHEESMQADGRARLVGLSREEGHMINDRRVMDGFGVRFHGPILQGELVLSKLSKVAMCSRLQLTHDVRDMLLLPKVLNHKQICF